MFKFKKQLSDPFGKLLYCDICDDPAYYKDEFFSGATGKYWVVYNCKKCKSPSRLSLWKYRRKQGRR